MAKLLDVLLGCCAHDRCTFPISVKPGERRSEAAGVTGIYIVCLDCGKELAYSWEEMKAISVRSRVKRRGTMTVPNLTSTGAEKATL